MQLRAFVTTCSNAIEKTGSSADASTDCEQSMTKIKRYVDNAVTIRSSWIAQYFNLGKYLTSGELVWNSFSRMSTTLDTSTTNNYYNFWLEEMRTTLLSSKLFQSYAWLSRLTGGHAEFSQFAPS